jgi:hypothetical protein
VPALRDAAGGTVSEPADAPQPKPEKYPWKEPRDREVDALALLTCAALDPPDYDTAVDLIESLDDAQRVSMIWVLARWYSCALAQRVEDPLAELRDIGLILAKGRGEIA